MKRRRGGERDGTDASGSAAALPALRWRLASPGGEGELRGDVVTTFVSPRGIREVGRPQKHFSPVSSCWSEGAKVKNDVMLWLPQSIFCCGMVIPVISL